MKTNIPMIDKAIDSVKSFFAGSAPKQSSAKNDTADKAPDLDKIILRRQQGAVINQGYVSLFVRIAAIAFAAWLIFSQLFLITQVHGNSMFPAMKDGDLVIGFRIQESYVKGDVIVFEHDGGLMVGRIVARSGDVITLGSNGTMLVNGTTQTGEIMYPTYAKEGVEYPFTIPDGHVFVMGDYRTQAEDSRDFGPVSSEDIAAKVITILRRRTI